MLEPLGIELNSCKSREDAVRLITIRIGRAPTTDEVTWLGIKYDLPVLLTKKEDKYALYIECCTRIILDQYGSVEPALLIRYARIRHRRFPSLVRAYNGPVNAIAAQLVLAGDDRATQFDLSKYKKQALLSGRIDFATRAGVTANDAPLAFVKSNRSADYYNRMDVWSINGDLPNAALSNGNAGLLEACLLRGMNMPHPAPNEMRRFDYIQLWSLRQYEFVQRLVRRSTLTDPDSIALRACFANYTG